MRHSRKLAGAVDTETFDAMAKVVDEAGGDPERPRTRRQLLKLAGGAVAGGAGLALLGGKAANAADGGNMIIGAANTGTNQTSIAAAPSFGAAAFSATYNGSSGYGLQAIGAGSAGDLKLSGTGRLFQVASAGATGGAAPTDYLSNSIARGDNNDLWASSAGGAWRRINAVRVDNPSNNGAPFTPFRLIDTRPAYLVGPLIGPFSSGSTQTVNVTSSPNIPDDAIAIFGNLTAVAPTYSGWLTIYPGNLGSPPPVSNVNFDTSQGAWPNSVFVGLSPTGTVKVNLGTGGASGTTSFILDISGYVQ